MAWLLSLIFVPLLIALGGLVQWLTARRLGVTGDVWPLIPIGPSVRAPTQVLVRASGLAGTFLLLFLSFFLVALSDEVVIARVEVAPGQAAGEAGVLDGDLVVASDGSPIESFTDLRDRVEAANGTIRLTVRRGDSLLEIPVTLRDGKLGVRPSMAARKVTALEAVRNALRMLNVPQRFLAVAQRAAAGPPPVQIVQTNTPTLAGMLAFGSFGLALAWWLTLGIEACALGLTALLRRSQS